ncbi:hypothetical protein [Roseimicrobium sp. ORNL1]|uniref:hypothetical protein n=1 Tax=Roseimicrobium sp. ORNL1 TaxID=2711231 RepID=UPI0013E1315E|nr:hypothetical protein [Roseimicrobium sp. ORNL1]QIF03260.1 hypothetical protein G5S37_17600 [Roseimicrobium sp. ORNL1]
MFARLFDYHSREDQRRALQWLDDPSEYPGLPKVESHKMVVQVYVAPSFKPMTSWSVYPVSRDKCLVRRIRWEQIADYQIARAGIRQENPTTYGADVVVEADKIRGGIDELSGLSLPMFNLSNSIGLDGVTFGVRRRTFGNFAEFSWWCEPPQGCDAIAAWYHRFVAQLELSLPAHTTLHRDGATHPYAPSNDGDSSTEEMQTASN